MAGVINVAKRCIKCQGIILGNNAVGLYISSLLTLTKAALSRQNSLNSYVVSYPSLLPLITNPSIFLSDILKDENSHSAYCPAYCRSVARITNNCHDWVILWYLRHSKERSGYQYNYTDHISFLRRFRSWKFSAVTKVVAVSTRSTCIYIWSKTIRKYVYLIKKVINNEETRPGAFQHTYNGILIVWIKVQFRRKFYGMKSLRNNELTEI
jgi:hypothetical protein